MLDKCSHVLFSNVWEWGGPEVEKQRPKTRGAEMRRVSPWSFWAHPFILALGAQGVREGPQCESRGRLGWGLSKWEGRTPFAQDEVTILEDRHPLQAASWKELLVQVLP